MRTADNCWTNSDGSSCARAGYESMKANGVVTGCVCPCLSVFVIAVVWLSIAHSATAAEPGPPVELTAQQDHQRLMDLLQITSLRRGADGSNRQATNYANYDESKANPFPNLPDPLTLKNGQKVTSPEMWWQKRRPEIVEDFDREIYGRVPKQTPA